MLSRWVTYHQELFILCTCGVNGSTTSSSCPCFNRWPQPDDPQWSCKQQDLLEISLRLFSPFIDCLVYKISKYRCLVQHTVQILKNISLQLYKAEKSSNSSRLRSWNQKRFSILLTQCIILILIIFLYKKKSRITPAVSFKNTQRTSKLCIENIKIELFNTSWKSFMSWFWMKLIMKKISD